MKASLSFLASLSLLTNTANAGTISIDWSTIECEEPLADEEVCYGKIKTAMGEDLSFETTTTRLFDDEETWKECKLENSTEIGQAFDSAVDGEKPAKGGRYFASDDSCTDRYKVIFKPWKFEKPVKKTLCTGGEVLETTNGKKCKKTCKSLFCKGFQISGKGNQKTCTFYGEGVALGDATESKFDKCILSKLPNKVVMGE
ncbi:predicted protein [Chaetoceros tenuissimus]|uniref:Uncharacterized protein n=1 Tax=Chaetoceros tenuissimus TaxID=426638 RepID=A0AAD3CWM5_9STRA|nr:predicted protein [Chaetoceros tenuissimus]